MWILAVGTLFLLPTGAGFSRLGWESAQLAGLCAALLYIVLCGAPLRSRAARPPSLLTLRSHSLLAWMALIAAALHVLGTLLADRVSLEYLKSSMPWYQWAAMAATVLMLLVTLLAIRPVRQALWRSHRGFQASHVVLSALSLLAIAAHVIGAARYVGAWWSRCLWIAAASGALLMLLRARGGRNALPPAFPRQGVFGRHAAPVLVAVTAVILAMLSLLPGQWSTALRASPVARLGGLPLDFPHTKHTEVPCAVCHHNFVDDRGLDNCIACHQSQRNDLQMGIEARFHGFCLQCHRHPDAVLSSHGPVSGCSVCHHVPS
jgi:hypothetical protein